MGGACGKMGAVFGDWDKEQGENRGDLRGGCDGH